MKITFLIILCLLSFAVKAQTGDTTKTKSEKFLPVDVIPRFNGDIMKYFHKNEKDNDNSEGKVMISFVVEADGSLTDITVVKSLSDSADKEAIRLMNQSPKWIPGMQGSTPVPVKYTMPIYFPAK